MPIAAAMAVLLTTATFAAAQPGSGGPGMMMGPGMMRMMGDCPMMGMMMGADTSSFADGRIAFIKAELAITDAQKGAWETYAAALKKNLQGMQAMRRTMVSVMDAKTPVERLEAHIKVMDGRLASLKEVKPALAALYGALSDDQKKKGAWAARCSAGCPCRICSHGRPAVKMPGARSGVHACRPLVCNAASNQ